MSSNTCAEKVPMNGEATGRGYQKKPAKKLSNKMYISLSLLFGILNTLLIILLIYLITTLKWPEEEACKPTETGKTAESMCLPCRYLPQFYSQSESLCCANSTQQWQNYVTAYVNVEFARIKGSSEGKAVSKRSLRSNARSKRSPEGEAVSKRSLPDRLTREKRAVEGIITLVSRTVNQDGGYIFTAELTLDFLQPNVTSKATCSIINRREGEVLFKETVPACLVKRSDKNCKTPISIGGYCLLVAGDTVDLVIDQPPDLVNVTLQVLSELKL